MPDTDKKFEQEFRLKLQQLLLEQSNDLIPGMIRWGLNDEQRRWMFCEYVELEALTDDDVRFLLYTDEDQMSEPLLVWSLKTIVDYACNLYSGEILETDTRMMKKIAKAFQLQATRLKVHASALHRRNVEDLKQYAPCSRRRVKRK